MQNTNKRLPNVYIYFKSSRQHDKEVHLILATIMR